MLQENVTQLAVHRRGRLLRRPLDAVVNVRGIVGEQTLRGRRDDSQRMLEQDS